MPSGRVFQPEKYVGQVYGQLTVREFSHWRETKAKFRHAIFECECTCGEVCEASIYNLRSGNTISCGCFRRELMTKHGMHGSQEYHIWEGIIQRGTGKGAKKYYADRGITVCDAWRGEGGFQAFFEHIGPRPSQKHSVDRIDNDRGYEPGNVRWATNKEQSRNKSWNRIVTVKGESMCLAEACERFGVEYGTAFYRLKRGWSAERTFGTNP